MRMGVGVNGSWRSPMKSDWMGAGPHIYCFIRELVHVLADNHLRSKVKS